MTTTTTTMTTTTTTAMTRAPVPVSLRSEDEQEQEWVAQVCEDTAFLLEGHWTQGHWLFEDRYCIEGALAATLGLDAARMDAGSPDRRRLMACPAYRAVFETLLLRGWVPRPPDEGELAAWNDLGSRTEAEVLDLLHATAKRVLGVGPDAA